VRMQEGEASSPASLTWKGEGRYLLRYDLDVVVFFFF
jgi:hypothetical protein